MDIAVPPGCVTGVGSLPFTDPRAAIRFVAEHSPVIPFWPQLPQRNSNEVMVVQGVGSLGGMLRPAAKSFCWELSAGAEGDFSAALGTAEACLLPAAAAGFFAFEHAVHAGEFPHAAAMKAQLIGPATLGCCVFAQGKPLASQPGWLDSIANFVARQAAWQIRRLRELGKPVIFVLDEPAIGFVYQAAPAQAAEIVGAISHVLGAIRDAGAIVGIHCCAPLPLQLVRAFHVDFLSFDAHLPADGEGWSEFVAAAFARECYVAFGLVPTDPHVCPDAEELYEHWRQLVAIEVDAIRVASKTLVTATCGLGLSTPGHAAFAFERCRQVGDRIASLARSLSP